ncbi:retrovirus-related pol polyprotein from transposon TNT 1-94 [Tanacetum coccineum]
MKTMNVTFDELSAMAFKQSSLKPGLQSMTSRQISGQPSDALRTVPAAQAPQVLQTPTATITTADTTPKLTNSFSQATNIPNTSQDVDELEPGQKHVQQQDNQALLQPKIVADNVPNVMLDGNTFVNPFAPPSTSDAESSSSQYVDPLNMHTFHVYKLKKALYGLKQAPRAWYNELSKFHLQNHFFKGTIDPTLFIRRFDEDILVVQVYADDTIFGSTNPRNTQLFADLMKIQLRDRNLKKYGMETCDPVGTPIEIKDKLDLDKNGTLAKTTEKHLKKVKRIFCYLQGTVNMGLWYTKDFGFELTGFSEADYAGCKDTFKSTSGKTQFLGKKLVGWSLKKQDCTALSTAKAEYVYLSACCAQVLWMRTQLTDYGFHFNKIPIYCGSKSTIAISCNPVQHSRTKHITVRVNIRFTLITQDPKFPEVKGWLDEDLEYYHLKELHYSAQCHTQMSLWIISRGVVLLILLMEYKFQVWYIELTSPSDHSNSRKNTRGKFVSPKKCLVWFVKYYANVRRTVADFSHAPPNEYSPSPNDKKQWYSWCGLTSTKFRCAR